MNEVKPKYKFTNLTVNVDGHSLKRIVFTDGTLGGFIESEKNLQGNARVLDISMVYGDAVVKDNAIISSGSSVYGNAIISGHANVSGACIVKDNAKVSDYARISCGMLTDHASVLGTANVENSKIQGDAQILGAVKDSKINGKLKIKGTVIDSELTQKRTVELDEIIKDIQEK